MTREDDEWGLQVGLVGPRAAAGLDFRLWPAAGYGAATGRLHWGVYLRRDLGEGFPTGNTALSRAREASALLPTEALAAAPPDVVDAGACHCVRWGALDLAAPDLGALLAARLRALIPALEAAADAVLALHVTTPRSWIEAALRALKADRTLVDAGAADVRIGAWLPGTYLTVRANSREYGWFTACADGRLAFHWEAPPEVRAERKAALLAVLNATPYDVPRWDGVVLLPADQIVVLQSSADTPALRHLLLTTWRTYRAVCPTT